MGWATTSVGILALRNLLGDGSTDKYCYRKKVFGPLNGTNLSFKTFEYRRVTAFGSAVAPIGVYKNDVLIATNKITSDNTATGEFVLDVSVVPSDGDSLTATYYYQWFTDTELDTFLQNASSWLGFGVQYQNIDDGLNASALRFAAQESYEKAAMKYSTRMSEVFRLEDAPSEDILKSIDAFRSMADNFMEKAKELRDDFYTRQGQSLSPLFNLSLGRVTDPTPRS